MTSKVKNILLSVVAAIVVVYLVVLMVFTPSMRHVEECKQVEVCVTDHSKRKYVTTAELQTYLQQRAGALVGNKIDSIPLNQLEMIMLQHPMLQSANAYFTPNGCLVVDVTQREPVFRVMNEAESYFVDAERKRMPVAMSTASFVPIVTGRVSQHFATHELFDFIQYISEDEYWDAQIAQVNVVSQKYIELVPRVGSGVIILGDLNGYQRRLRKLRKLYKDGFSTFGWDTYKEIDLRFHGQVVCRR